MADFSKFLANNYLTKVANKFMNVWAIFKHTAFKQKNLLWLLFGQLLETIWLLFIPTSGHCPDHWLLFIPLPNLVCHHGRTGRKNVRLWLRFDRIRRRGDRLSRHSRCCRRDHRQLRLHRVPDGADDATDNFSRVVVVIWRWNQNIFTNKGKYRCLHSWLRFRSFSTYK